MTRKEFESNVIMAVEIEYDDFGGRFWHTMKGSEVRSFLDNLGEGEGFSDIDYCSKQENSEIREILDKAEAIWMDSKKRAGFKSLDEVINSLLTEEDQAPAKRVWTEDEIRNLIQTNDKALYRGLLRLYQEQTADEQRCGETSHRNGVGFNGTDSKFLSSVAEFLKKTGFLTEKQRCVTRRKMMKYVGQLTRLANI